MSVNPVKKRWVSEIALEEDYFLGSKRQLKLAETILNKTKALYQQYLIDGVMSDELIKGSLLLAQLDAAKRPREIVKNFGKTNENDVEDLKNLIKVIPKNDFKADKFCALNPTFGKGSDLVGGGDADLIIDNTLIDLKTVKDLTFERKYLNQLIGYYILSEIGNSNVKEKIKIEKLGIYFSRYGILYKFDIKEILMDVDMPKFIKWFKKRARYYHPCSGVEIVD